MSDILYDITTNSKDTPNMQDNSINIFYLNYALTPCYQSRIITSTQSPKFKLNAFCINLKNRQRNMDFIHSEWDEFCNIERFIALSSCTKSHVEILKRIYKQKENTVFPVVIMEDDVYKKNNFSKYWNQLLYLTECDYVALDAFFLQFRKSQDNVHPDFLSLSKHRATGFTIYYKRFFDRFQTINELKDVFRERPMDMHFTRNPVFINYTPKEQICCQIVSKHSTTTRNSKKYTGHYRKYYIAAEKLLKSINV